MYEGRRGWCFRGDPDVTWPDLRDRVWRLVARVPVTSLRLHTFDPLLSGRMSGFASLRLQHPSAFPAAVAGPGELRRVLARPSVIDLHAVVLLDYPAGIDSALQQELLRLAEPDGAGPVLLVQHDDARTPTDRAVRPTDLTERLTHAHHPATGG
ncbi:hypothetical protein ACFP3Q_17935 [Nocardioides sp. GCM10027113]|uniref:hypothetical protein n=1 Tax=unclassified Nocardioides TaxID=2615069 RepID=UPI0036217528